MRRYEKPVMQVERYAVKNTICSGCNRVTIDQVVVPKANQTIDCIAQTSAENCFNTASGCGNTVKIVTLGTTYSSNDNKSLATWINRGAKTSEMGSYSIIEGDRGKYDAYAGDYVVWTDEHYHAGPVSTYLQDKYGLSY